MELIKEINLNINQPNNFELINVMQSSVNSVRVIAHLYDGNQPYQIPDTVSAYQLLGILPSGKYLMDGKVSKYNATSVSFLIHKNMMAKPGYVCFTISLLEDGGGAIVETFPAKIMVTAIPGQDYEQTDEIPLVTESLREVKINAENAAQSAKVAKTSETNAKTAEMNADTSEQNARKYADNAKTSETNAKKSESNTKTSETNAKTSETNAKTSETNAGNSASASATSASKAKTSETNAKASETASKTSETNAKTSETNAANSATKAESYAVGGTNSRDSENTDNAKYYSQQASSSASSASTSASTATTKASQAATSATNAANSATTAMNKASAASTSASQAATSADTASTKANEAKTSATQSQDYATGSTNSSKYYYEQAKSISESLSGALRPIGTVAFANLPSVSSASEGDMYNVSDKFATTADFKEGAGNVIPAGANVYKTIDGYWDILAGTPVTSVNGKRGDVNITPANIGLGNVDNTADADKSVKYAGTTDNVSGYQASADKDRHVWFSDSAYETMRSYDDDLKYNPATKTLKVKNVSGNAESADCINVTHGNEIKFSGNNGIIDTLWFNYSLPDGQPAQTKLRQYCFGDGQRNTTGVTLKADNFSGNAATATNADKLDGYHAADLPVSTPQQTALNGKVNKSGDTMTGNLNVKNTSQPQVILSRTDSDGNILRSGMLQVSASNNFGLWDITNSKWMCYSSQDGSIVRFLGLADKATQDGSGNNISTTYLKRSGGTMTGMLTTGSNAIKFLGDRVIQSINSNGIEFFWTAQPTKGFSMWINGGNTSNFTPRSDGSSTLGGASSRWGQIYSTNSTISTSDRRKKHDISYIGQHSDYDTSMTDDQLENFVMGLSACIYRLNDGDSGRPHHGLIAQDIEELMQEIGLADHAGFIKSPKTKDVEIEKDIEKEIINDAGEKETIIETQKTLEQEVIPGEYIYSLRYEEFIADIIRFAQIQKTRSDKLEERLAESEKKSEDLEKRIKDLEQKKLLD